MNEKIKTFSIGRKVRINTECGFAKGIDGVIAYPPKVEPLNEDFGSDYFREVQMLKGKKFFVWVVFDEPQFDTDGDGPYSEAEINIDYLEVIEN